MRRASLLCTLLTALACSTLAPSEVLVHVDADSVSRKRARQLHVRVVSEEGAIHLDRVASLVGDPADIQLPTTVPLVPQDGDSARTFTIFAELIDQAKAAFNKKAATLSFVDQTRVDVDLYFSDLCIGIDCPEGQTCSDGACVDLRAPPVVPPPSPAPRDPLKWPFASDSIWNTPIGSGAIYVAANLPAIPGGDTGAPMPAIDDEIIVLHPSAPMTAINLSSVAWGGGDRCPATGGLLFSVPMPSDFTVPSSAASNASAFLMPDGRTLMQTEPLARCVAGGPATSFAQFAAVDLYGAGITGAHGGSGLSALGGSIRVGELRPDSPWPRHALKVSVYGKQVLYKCQTNSDCFRWPATTADGYAVGQYGVSGPNTNAAMKEGALLAIPASTDLSTLNLETAPAKQLAWTLQNYGAYIDGDTFGPSLMFDAENGPDGSVRAQFKGDWGFDMAQRVSDGTPWVRDVQRLAQALSVVDNNGPSSIGGGGAPRQPLAPPIQP